MLAAIRHQPSLDLNHKSSMESFYSAADSTAGSFDFELPAKSQDRLKPNPLRLATSAPALPKRYQSDEEQPSPGMEEDYSESSSSETGSDVDVDETIDLDALEPIQVVSPSQLARAVPIVFEGRPSLISVSTLAPMARRTTRPALGSRTPSTASLHQAALAVPIPPRSTRRHQAQRSISLYEPAVVVDHVPAAPRSATPTPARPAFGGSVTNFSAPLRRLRPSPLAAAAATTPQHSSSESTDSSSSPPTLEPESQSDAESEVDEGDALMQEAQDITVRTASLERERAFALGRWAFDADDESEPKADDDELADVMAPLDATPMPTAYQTYDPFALEPAHLEPALEAAPRRDSTASVTTATKKGWRGLMRVGRRGTLAA